VKTDLDRFRPQFAPLADPSRNWSTGLIALGIYQIIAILFFGIPVLGHPREVYVGSASTDPSVFMWLLVWWPYAITHHVNPFITRLIWVPGGANVTWTHFIFAPSIVAWPLTRAFGPVVAWNILCLLALALDAWSGFLLCRRLCHSFLAALLGGYLFGFSPYVLGHMLGHLSLIMVFPVPLAVYLVLACLDGRISSTCFTLLLALVALLQFLCSQEIFATSVVLGSVVMLLALAIAPIESRRSLVRICPLSACAIAISVLLSAPFWYYIIAVNYQQVPIQPPEVNSSDLLEFVIPTSRVLVDKIPILPSITQRFSASILERNTYLGLPLILVVLAFAVSNRSSRASMMLVLALVAAAVLSLGPRLHIAGAESVYLPYWLATRLPLINQALPVRFSMYIFLATAIIVSMWLATPERRVGRWLLAGMGVGSLIPNLALPIWSTRVDTPRFFTDGTYKSFLATNEVALILPYGSHGNSMLWQAETGMFFRMAGGYCSYTPDEYVYWPVLHSLFGDQDVPNFKQQMEAFLTAHGVNVIIVANHAREMRVPLEFEFFPRPFSRDAVRFFAPLRITPIAVGGVLLYRLPPYRNLAIDGRGQRSAGLGQKVSVSSVRQSGTAITVNGGGFSVLTVINFYNKQGGRVVNLGGLKWGGGPMIPILSVSENTLTFAKPAGAVAGASYVQALNPPYTSLTSSGNGPGGNCVLH